MGVVLLLVEPTGGDPAPSFWERVAVARLLSATRPRPLEVVVMGGNTDPARQAASAAGATRIHVVDDDRLEGWPEAVAGIMTDICEETVPDAVIVPRSVLGAEVASRLACRLGVGMAMDAMDLTEEEAGLVVSRPVFGGAATARILLERSPWILVPRKGAFAPAPAVDGPAAEVRLRPADLAATPLRTIVVARETLDGTGHDLEAARVVVAGGRGMGGPEPFAMLGDLAARLGGVVAASRPPCDAGWVEPTLQIGLTGATISPDLYLAVGISGATQHMTGCSTARCIVAVNNDPDAPIFRMATYGVVGDWEEVLPGLLEALDDPTMAARGSKGGATP